jgi:6,7-dimethyl-8-ribityllumazine synthase
MSLKEAKHIAKRIPIQFQESALWQEGAAQVKCVQLLSTLWYPDIMEGLLRSAMDTLESLGVSNSAIKWSQVPGGYELPLAAQQALPCDFVVALGCIIEGETPHFDFVSRACIDGLSRVSLEHGVPVGLGVLTVANEAQARARTEKGAEAAQAAFLMYLNGVHNTRIRRG